MSLRIFMILDISVSFVVSTTSFANKNEGFYVKKFSYKKLQKLTKATCLGNLNGYGLYYLSKFHIVKASAPGLFCAGHNKFETVTFLSAPITLYCLSSFSNFVHQFPTQAMAYKK